MDPAQLNHQPQTIPPEGPNQLLSKVRLLDVNVNDINNIQGCGGGGWPCGLKRMSEVQFLQVYKCFVIDDDLNP